MRMLSSLIIHLYRLFRECMDGEKITYEQARWELKEKTKEYK